MEKVFKTLSKQQHAVMDVLCTKQHSSIAATDLKPATLGSLCAKKLVNVEDGKVHATYPMLWNMTFHKEMFDMVSKKRMDDISTSIKMGYRIAAIMMLREGTGWDIHEAMEWMDHHFPK